MNNKAQAVGCFKEGFCCSQAVFATFAPQLGLDKKTALKISDSFGGGMSRASICGAVTGALLVIGLKYGRSEANDLEAKNKNRALVKEFLNRFQERNGALECKLLLDCDISTPEGHDLAKKNDLFNTVCPKLIEDAVDILENLPA